MNTSSQITSRDSAQKWPCPTQPPSCKAIAFFAQDVRARAYIACAMAGPCSRMLRGAPYTPGFGAECKNQGSLEGLR